TVTSRRLLALLVVVALAVAGTVVAGPPTVMYEGQLYVELPRVADMLRTKAEATAGSTQAHLRPPGHVVTLTRNWARILFEGAAGEIRASALADPPRLVLDFTRPSEPVPSRRDALMPLRTIVLDAGHGGHDPGATGPAGLMEKDLVLDVTRRVARLIEDKL